MCSAKARSNSAVEALTRICKAPSCAEKSAASGATKSC